MAPPEAQWHSVAALAHSARSGPESLRAAPSPSLSVPASLGSAAVARPRCPRGGGLMYTGSGATVAFNE
jgi:hypothetical protein